MAVGTLEWLRRHGASGPAPDGSAEGAAAPDGAGGDGVQRWSTAQSRVEECSGHTRVYVSIGDSIAACIDVADELRPGAAATVAGLRRMGVRCVLLSGAVWWTQ